MPDNQPSAWDKHPGSGEIWYKTISWVRRVQNVSITSLVQAPPPPTTTPPTTTTAIIPGSIEKASRMDPGMEPRMEPMTESETLPHQLQQCRGIAQAAINSSYNIWPGILEGYSTISAFPPGRLRSNNCMFRYPCNELDSDGCCHDCI